MSWRGLIGCLLLVGSSIKMASCQSNVQLIHFNQLNEWMTAESDSVLVLNFWATWCKPCVEELPAFIQLEQEFANQKVRFVYISLDFKRELDTSLKNFILRKQFKSSVALLDEPDYNAWIDKVDPSWQGAIPATLVLDRKNGRRTFHEGELNYESLKSILKKYLP